LSYRGIEPRPIFAERGALYAHEIKEKHTMGILILVVLGAALGWVASLLSPTDKQGVLVNAVAGMVGALLGGWLLRPLFGSVVMSPNSLSIGGLLESALGAVVLLGVVRLVRRGMRTDDHDQ
jgi:uncharacterized membrane protein YeaQ/YmgE (transglycosylase-associated protein family)